MDFVHCNACQDEPSHESRSFWFTNCMHIYCKNCVQKLRAPNSEMVMCVHCNKLCQIIEIGPNMPPKLKRLFTPYEQVMKEHMETLKRVLTFQEDQLNSLLDFAKKEKANLLKAVQAFQEANAKITTVAHEKIKLKEAVQYHKNRLDEFEKHIGALKDSMNVSSQRTQPNYAAASQRTPSNYAAASQRTQSNYAAASQRSQSNYAAASQRSQSNYAAASQRTPSNYARFGNSMLMDGNASANSSFNGFLNYSQMSTPMYSQLNTSVCSQLSNGQLTTPKMLGLTKRRADVSMGGLRSDNPYLALWNQTSIDRQKRARMANSRDVSMESPLAWNGWKGPSTGFGG